LAEVNPALRSAGYAEEFVRVGMRLLAEIDWTKAIVGEYQQFDLIWAILVEELSHLGRWSVADRLIDRYQTSIGARSARYVNLCGLASYSYWMRGDYENAKAWGKKGVELKRESGLDTKYDSAHNLALARRDSGEVDSALQYFLKDQTVDELLATSGKDERASHVFGNVGRCLWLKSDRIVR